MNLASSQPAAAASPRRAVLAVFRPLERDIAMFVEDGGRHSSTTLSLDEARAIHGALELALKLAAKAGDPIGAVSGKGMAE